MSATPTILSILIAMASAGSGNVARQLDGFPSDYVGRWSDEADGCSPGAGHGGLTIRPKLVADGEFTGEVQSVVRKPDDSIDVTEVWDIAETPPAKSTSNYALSKNGRPLTVRTLGPSSEYLPAPLALVKCGAHR